VIRGYLLSLGAEVTDVQGAEDLIRRGTEAVEPDDRERLLSSITAIRRRAARPVARPGHRWLVPTMRLPSGPRSTRPARFKLGATAPMWR